MPTPPYARLAVRVNSGAQQFGGITATHGDEIRLEAESTAFWGSPAAVWEIYDYPEGWTGPGAPWVSIAIPQQGNLPDAVVFQYYGNSFPPPFNLPALPYWGKFQVSLLINGGIGAIRANLYDENTAVQILSPAGLVEPGFRETRQFGSWRGWNGVLKALVRSLDTALGGLFSLSNTAPQPIGTASAGVGTSASRDDHVHSAGVNLALAAGATSSLTKTTPVAGPGTGLIIRADNGFLGAGGDLTIGPGAGSTPDVIAGGNMTVAMQSDGAASGMSSWTAGTLGTFLTIAYLDSTSTTTFSTTKTTLALNAATSLKRNIAGSLKETLTAAALNLEIGVDLQRNGVSWTSSATNDSPMLRDAAGRASVTDPAVSTDIATANYADANRIKQVKDTSGHVAAEHGDGWVDASSLTVTTTGTTDRLIARAKMHVEFVAGLSCLSRIIVTGGPYTDEIIDLQAVGAALQGTLVVLEGRLNLTSATTYTIKAQVNIDGTPGDEVVSSSAAFDNLIVHVIGAP